MRHSHITHLHPVLHRLPSFLIDQIFESLRQCSPGMRAPWAQRVNERPEARGCWSRKADEETGTCLVGGPLTTRSTQPSGTITALPELAGEAGWHTRVPESLHQSQIWGRGIAEGQAASS